MDTMAKEIVISRSGLTALEQELEELKEHGHHEGAHAHEDKPSQEEKGKEKTRAERGRGTKRDREGRGR